MEFRLKRGELKHLGILSLHSFLGSLIAFVGIYFVIFLYQRGFTLADIALVMALFSIGRIAFELPTGAVADVIGRKTCCIVGSFLQAGMILFMPFVHSMIHMGILFLL